MLHRLRSHRRSTIGPMAVLLAALTVPAPDVSAAGEPDAPPPFRFGAFVRQIDGLESPSGAAVTGDGRIIVTEAGRHRVVVLDADGRQRVAWGGIGDGPGQFVAPADVAVSPAGEVFIVDAGNHRVQVFDLDGRFLRQWGTYGTDAGEFRHPHGVDVDRDRVCIADAGNRRVQVFDHAGTWQVTLGDAPAPAAPADARADGAASIVPRPLRRPIDVAILPDGPHAGGFVVTDADANRVLLYDRHGQLLATHGDWGPHTGLLDQPTGVTAGRGRIFVADRRNHRISIFDAAGAHRGEWGVHALRPREGEGRLHYPESIAIDPHGRFAVIVEPFENRVQIIAARAQGDPPNASPAVPGVAADAHFGRFLTTRGRLLAITEPETHQVRVFDLRRDDPVLMTTFGMRGDAMGRFIHVTGVDISIPGHGSDPGADAPADSPTSTARRPAVALADAATGRLQIFALDHDPAGPLRYAPFAATLARAVDLAAVTGVTVRPGAVRRGPEGQWFVIDEAADCIRVYDADLRCVRAVGRHGRGEGEFRRPCDLAFSPDGTTLYVVDRHNQRVQVFDRDGTFRFAFGSPGEGRGRFFSPAGIAVDADGFVYVSDDARHTVQKFDARGRFISTFGEQGSDPSRLWKPAGLAVDERGRLFVSDFGNHRIQAFTTDGEWLMSFGVGRVVRERAQSVEGEE